MKKYVYVLACSMTVLVYTLACNSMTAFICMECMEVWALLTVNHLHPFKILRYDSNAGAVLSLSEEDRL